MIIRLLRHGMTEANEKRLYCGFTDLPLSERGVMELKQLKAESLSYSLYVSSGLKRAVSTMEILFGRKPDIAMPDFREMNFGCFEMRSHDELITEPDYIRWLEGDENVCCPNGESREAFSERTARALAELVSMGKNAAVVCHGGVIVTIMDKLFPDQRDFYEWQPAFGRGYTVKFCENKAVSWAD